MSENIDETLPIFSAQQPAGPGDSLVLIQRGGADVQRALALTGKDKFEHMVLYCLNLLHQAGTGICAFYVSDFDDCDEKTMRVLSNLIGRAGYVVSDYIEKPSSKYVGFWAWRQKK